MNKFIIKLASVTLTLLILSSCGTAEQPELTTSPQMANQDIVDDQENNLETQETQMLVVPENKGSVAGRKDLVGDMTVSKAYKLPSINQVGSYPCLCHGKVITDNPAGDVIKEIEVEDEINENKYSFQKRNIVMLDPMSGNTVDVISDVMLNGYINYQPLSDGKTCIVSYYGKDNMPSDNQDKYFYTDVLKHPTYVKVDMQYGTTEVLDMSKIAGSEQYVNFSLLGSDYYILDTYTNDVVTRQDYEDRNVDDDLINQIFSENNAPTESTHHYYLMNVKTHEAKEIITQKLSGWRLAKGEKGLIDLQVYDRNAVALWEKVSDDDVYTQYIEIYDDEYNSIYTDELYSCSGEAYYDSTEPIPDFSMSQGTVYVHSYSSTYLKYIISNGKVTKQPIDPVPSDTYSSYRKYTNRNYAYIDYQMTMFVDEGDGLPKISLVNPCTGENVTLLINIEGYTAPKLMYGSFDCIQDFSGDYLIPGNGSQKDSSLEFWYIPKEEIARALYG